MCCGHTGDYGVRMAAGAARIPCASQGEVWEELGRYAAGVGSNVILGDRHMSESAMLVEILGILEALERTDSTDALTELRNAALVKVRDALRDRWPSASLEAEHALRLRARTL